MIKTKSKILGLLRAGAALVLFGTNFLGANEMVLERTYAMIKPAAVAAGHVDAIVKRIEDEGFSIIAKKDMQMSKALAEAFYAVHSAKPFYEELVNSIASGPIVAMVLEKEGAIAAWRELMGATNPSDAAEGTLRKLYGTSIGENATHGSDAPETAMTEIELVFPELD